VQIDRKLESRSPVPSHVHHCTIVLVQYVKWKMKQVQFTSGKKEITSK
jgi:hypothetical protein